MQGHTTIGASILAGSASTVLRMACEIAQSHHERWDGTGYPHGLSKTNIPESARIVGIVDVYDALTHDRVYRRALPENEAVAFMRKGCSSTFDPWLLDLFFTVIHQIRRIARAHPDQRDSAWIGTIRQN